MFRIYEAGDSVLYSFVDRPHLQGISFCSAASIAVVTSYGVWVGGGGRFWNSDEGPPGAHFAEGKPPV